MIRKWLGKRYRILLAAIMALAAVAAVWNRMGIFFATDDDRVIAEMLAGTIVQTPDPCVRLVNWLLAVPLCLLYGIAGQIPWYGLCLILFQVASWTVIFYGILYCCESSFEVAAGIAVGGGCFLINLYSLGLIQFTSTAALMATAGYVYFILRRDSKSIWVFGCMELFSCLLRRDAMLMIQPLGGMTFLGVFWLMKEWKQDGMKRLAQWAGTLGVVLLLGLIGDLVGYRGAEWREYDRYNQARIEMFDYYGTPSYEEAEDILDKYQVTRTEYEAYCNYVMLEGDISPDCAEELANRAKEMSHTEVNVMELLRQTVFGDVYRDPLAGGSVMLILWICLVLWLTLSGQFRSLAPLLGLGIARTAVWSYIFYRGRIPPRVSYSLIFCESMLLVAVFVKTCACGKKKWWIRLGALCLICILLAQGYRTGQTQYRFVKTENQGQDIYIRGLREIRNYCESHSDRRFFLENGSFSFYKGSALETDIYKPANGMYTGGWNANTPVLRKYLETYMGGVWGDFYLIIYDNEEALDVQANNAVVRYFREKSGAVPVLEERITASHGGAYLVWHFAGEQ